MRIVAVPISQLLGHGDFLQALMGDKYDRSYKRVIEETLGLMGYILVFAGTVEAALELRAESSERLRPLKEAGPILGGAPE